MTSDKCPLRRECISAGAKTKKVQHSYYKPLLEAAKQRALSVKGFRMRRKRSSTVEPVWGTLINFYGIKRINTRGLEAANKCLILAAACYNLKKWMKHIVRNSNVNLGALSKTSAKGLNKALNLLLHLIQACLAHQLLPAVFLSKKSSTFTACFFNLIHSI